jgi:hypothetical protein
MRISANFEIRYKDEVTNGNSPYEAAKSMLTKMRENKTVKDKCIMRYSVSDFDTNIKVSYPEVELEVEDITPTDNTTQV